jgi:hypothetical protein
MPLLASLRDAGCSCIVSGGIARSSLSRPANRCQAFGLKISDVFYHWVLRRLVVTVIRNPCSSRLGILRRLVVTVIRNLCSSRLGILRRLVVTVIRNPCSSRLGILRRLVVTVTRNLCSSRLGILRRMVVTVIRNLCSSRLGILRRMVVKGDSQPMFKPTGDPSSPGGEG